MSSKNNPFTNAIFNGSSDIVMLNDKKDKNDARPQNNPHHFTSGCGDNTIAVATNASLTFPNHQLESGLYSFTVKLDMSNVQDPPNHISCIAVGIASDTPEYITQNKAKHFPFPYQTIVNDEPGMMVYVASKTKKKPYYITCVYQVLTNKNNNSQKLFSILFMTDDEDRYEVYENHFAPTTLLRPVYPSCHNTNRFFPTIKHCGNATVEFEILDEETHKKHLESSFECKLKTNPLGEVEGEVVTEQMSLQSFIFQTITYVCRREMWKLEAEEHEARRDVEREWRNDDDAETYFKSCQNFLQQLLGQTKPFFKRETEARKSIQDEHSSKLSVERHRLRNVDPDELKERLRQRLANFFTKHAPYNLGRVDVIMSNLNISSGEYFRQLCFMHGVEEENEEDF